MRATAIAIFYFVMNVIGIGLGPPLIGRASDWLGHLAAGHLAAGHLAAGHLAAGHGSQASGGLTAALALISCVLICASVHFYIAGRRVGRRAR
jgi:hypothetical protein